MCVVLARIKTEVFFDGHTEHLAGVIAEFAGPLLDCVASDLRNKPGMVCSAALRRCAFNLLKAISIGLRSGE